jgi:iron complex transport system substrate-binding protein
MRATTRRPAAAPLSRPAALAIAAAFAITCAACGSSGTGGSSSASGSGSGGGAAGGTGFPVTVSAANGKVQLKTRPAAIISLSPTATEMLYAIGAGPQVKAVDADSDFPPQAPRTKLSGFEPNVEAIAADQPDLVVVSGDTGGLIKRLGALSVPVLELPAATNVGGVYAEFDQLGRATGHLPAAQREDTALRRQIRQIVATAPHRAAPLTYYYELDQTYYSVTSSTFVGRLLALLGLKSIADTARTAVSSGGYPQLSSEFIVKARPDYIILADTVCCHQDSSSVARRPGWASIPAVRNGHIIGLNDDIASRWGPRIVNLLATVETATAGKR